jgi:hypothetical protein
MKNKDLEKWLDYENQKLELLRKKLILQRKQELIFERYKK